MVTDNDVSMVDIKDLQRLLAEKDDDGVQNSSRSVGKLDSKLLQEKNGQIEEPSYKVRVPKKIIPMPEEPKQSNIERSSYEWKYKQKNIEDLQQFLDENAEMVPTSLKTRLNDVRDNLTDDEAEDSSEDEEDDGLDAADRKKIREYDDLMAEVCYYN